jgi:hypothetical protein
MLACVRSEVLTQFAHAIELITDEMTREQRVATLAPYTFW